MKKNYVKQRPNNTLPSESVELIKLYDKKYPDVMVVDDKMTEFERAKLAGKVELIRELKRLSALSETENLKEI